MTMRTASRAKQWRVWLWAAFVALLGYILVSRLLYGEISWSPLEPATHRVALPVLIVLAYVMWVTRWDGITRKAAEAPPAHTGDAHDERPVPPPPEPAPPAAEAAPEVQAAPLPEPIFVPLPQPMPAPDENAPEPSAEELFTQARALPHHIIPDYEEDGAYLDLLGRSAKLGYAPALAKLGEYAMRRSVWVEAYYWMYQAQRYGMEHLDGVLREIRKNWMRAGAHREMENVHNLFSPEAGAIGLAWLKIATGTDAATAKQFLQHVHPELLSRPILDAPPTSTP